MPVLPEVDGIKDQIVEGLYKFADAPVIEGADIDAKRATILFSGSAQGAAREAARELAEHYGVGAELWSVTSYKALRENGLVAERHNRLHPSGEAQVPLVARRLAESSGPITAVTDFMSAVPDQIRQFLPHSGEDHRTFTTLGTDGMGRSDTREALRRFFEIDTGHVVVGVLAGLLADGKIEASVVEDAIARYDIDPDAVDPWNSFVE
jgi:pyruvate dehydrogenase E1 component